MENVWHGRRPVLRCSHLQRFKLTLLDVYTSNLLQMANDSYLLWMARVILALDGKESRSLILSVEFLCASVFCDCGPNTQRTAPPSTLRTTDVELRYLVAS